jgi:hypothetical protein
MATGYSRGKWSPREALGRSLRLLTEISKPDVNMLYVVKMVLLCEFGINSIIWLIDSCRSIELPAASKGL